MTTLKALLETLGDVKKAEKHPTSRKLREEAGEPIITTEHFLIYPCGYAVYENESGRTVMWVPGCTRFTYHFIRGTGAEIQYVPQAHTLPDGMLEDLPWEMVLTLIGDHRIEANRMNCAMGSRKGTDALDEVLYGDKCDDAEEALEKAFQREFQWREDQIGEDPETIVIRKETREEALASMTAKQKNIFLLYFAEGYRQREIAEMLDIAQPTVYRHLARALNRVRNVK